MEDSMVEVGSLQGKDADVFGVVVMATGALSEHSIFPLVVSVYGQTV